MARNDGRPGRAQPFTVLVGNPKPQSRTRQVVLRAAELLQADLARVGVSLTEAQLVDLAEIAPPSVVAPTGLWGTSFTEALGMVTRGGLLIVGSPTFKGTFTGLLKLFVDLLPRQALGATVALPLMTAARAEDQHAVESYLRPLLIALGAAVPAKGICVLEAQLGALDDVLIGWSADAARVLGGLLVGGHDRLLART